MKTLLATLMVGVLACATAPASAQEKKSDPAKDQSTKPDVKKAEKVKKEPGEKVQKVEAKKDDGKKKVKKGGC